MVKVMYYGMYRTSFGVEEETIRGKTLKSVIKKIEKKYKRKEYVNTIKYSMIFHNGQKTLSSRNDLEFKLKPKDELVFAMIAGGG